jgi:glycosyltransferase involved in cell wall biosynthesis
MPPTRIGFYNPFLAALGGGDKYLFTILEAATKLPGAELVLFCPNDPVPEQWDRLGLAVSRDAFTWTRGHDAVVTEQSRSLDLLVAMANDIPVLSHAQRSVAIIQFPYRARDRLRARARAWLLAVAGRERAASALASYDRFLCYSRFTQTWTRRRLGVEAAVIEPPIDVPEALASPKRPQILCVARFVEDVHDKRHELLIRTFAQLRERCVAAHGWSLQLVGSAGESSERLLTRLRALGRGLPIEFHVNASRDRLARLYDESALFWHGTGFGVDAQRHPERLEHFGIVVAEAMAHGAVPLVFAAGGPAEIVADGRTGCHWRTRTELVERTRELIEDTDAAATLRAAAVGATRRYDKKRFLEAIDKHVFTLLAGDVS